jgi:hypothetical protein
MDDISSYIVIGFIAFSILTTFLALRYHASRRRLQKEGAGELAALLGFRILPPEESIRRSYERSGSAEGAQMYEKLPAAFLELVKRNAPWMMEGERGGLPVSIYQDVRGSGKSQTNYTVVRVAFHEALGFELRLSREGAMTKLGKSLFHLQDIELGDPEVDPFVRIKSSDPEAARQLLSSPASRRALVQAISQAPGFHAASAYVDWERVGNVTDSSVITTVLDVLLPLAKALGGSPKA